MDQIRIGKFIAERRKKENLTQAQLAEKLNITDRAVSKWENGRSLPDPSIMPELCGILKITINDLFSGEVVTMDKINDQLEKNLLELAKEKEKADKRLLSLEIVIGVVSTAFLFTLVLIAALIRMPDWARILLIGVGFVQFLVSMFFAVRIEQIAGYYECKECGHRYVPSFAAVNLAMHMGRTRYMKCPKCGKRSWQKKVLSREKDKAEGSRQ